MRWNWTSMRRSTVMCSLAASAMLAGLMNGWTGGPARSAEPNVPPSGYRSDAAHLLPLTPRQYVRMRASRHGWTVGQWRCAERLVARESGWRVHADNAFSSAYGLFQILRTPEGTPLHEQVDRFFRYVGSRYGGDPCAALQHSLTKGWY